MFPWVGCPPLEKETEFKAKIYTFKIESISFHFQQTQYKFFSNQKELISEFQKRLFFPVMKKKDNEEETLACCNVAMLFFVKTTRAFTAFIPQQPSFYGYRAFVIEKKATKPSKQYLIQRSKIHPI